MSTTKIKPSEVAQIAAQLLTLQRRAVESSMPQTGAALGLALEHLGWEAAKQAPLTESAKKTDAWLRKNDPSCVGAFLRAKP